MSSPGCPAIQTLQLPFKRLSPSCRRVPPSQLYKGSSFPAVQGLQASQVSKLSNSKLPRLSYFSRK
jgi:hypothetical protein